MASQPWRCGGVASANVSSNQRRTKGRNSGTPSFYRSEPAGRPSGPGSGLRDDCGCRALRRRSCCAQEGTAMRPAILTLSLLVTALAVVVLLEIVTLSGAAGQSPAAERFDYVVRDDFFAGLRGDVARLDRAMKTCEEMLARNPRHAEALVWHGAGLLAQARLAFERGDAA